MADVDNIDGKEMYSKLRSLWMSSGDPDEDPDQRAWEFDTWFAQFVMQQQAAKPEIPELEVSRAQMMMEVILEVEQVVTMVPPRVKSYRDLLAAAGLDRAVEDAESGAGAGGGQKGLPGINLADQAALEFHSNILGMAFGLAQEEVLDRARRKQAGAESEGLRG